MVSTRKVTKNDRIFNGIVIVIATLIAFLFLLPLLNVLASSFSSADDIVAGKVGLFPSSFTLEGYRLIFAEASIWRGFLNSLLYTALGTLITVVCEFLCAYPLSRRDFKGKKAINLFLILTMFISGGLIPTYLLVMQLHLYNTIWAIILPGCISVFNIIVIRTYMQTSISPELQEAAMIDGCSDFMIFWKVVLPLCRPIIAVMILYAVVGYWNSYFNALMYVKDSALLPLQNVLSNILVSNTASLGSGENPNVAEQLKYVTIVISSLPLLLVYPFFQKYFEQGVTIGGLKG